MVFLVLLRISIGWHFAYQGLAKLQDPDYSAASVIKQSKGPFATTFRRLIPDADGKEILTLAIETSEKPGEDGAEPVAVTGERLKVQWEKFRQQFEDHFDLAPAQVEASKRLMEAHWELLQTWVADERAAISYYLQDLDKLQADEAQPWSDVFFQQQRLWDERQTLQAMASPWLSYVKSATESFHEDLYNEVLTEAQREDYPPLRDPWTMLSLMDKWLPWLLVAGGVCLMAGLLTRLTAWCCAAFLAMVWLSQLDLGNAYPPPHPSAGPQFIVSKEFIEMMALLVIGTSPVGRWAGLDFFLHALIFGTGRKSS